ncbi:MAG: ribose transport system substrate-binding protein [Fimbriimonadaceae bacterium]|jgi:ribose transport system substrate-binding protein|nr:ribose transport system substrate-binding protein [Fimbriimonadaceae bacterium]
MNWRGLAGAAIAGLILGGCSSNETAGNTTTTTGGAGAKTALKIALIAKSSTNPVFLASRTGAEDAAKEFGAKNNVDITIDWLTPQTESGEEQAKRIASAVNQGDNVILISCSDAAKVTGAINDAVDKGVQVMTFDSDAPASKRFAFYGTDDETCGKQVMEELAKQMNGKGNVAILAGNQNAPNLQKRANAVREEAKKYPGIKIVDVFYHNETPNDANAAVRQAMSANPQINGWAMVGGWPLFAKSLLDLDPNKVKIVAVDALPAQLAYVEKGVAPVLLAQPVYEWGHTSVGMIVDKVLLQKDVPVINRMELVRVTKDNLGEWANQLAKWGFTDVDPKYLAMKSNKPAATKATDTN